MLTQIIKWFNEKRMRGQIGSVVGAVTVTIVVAVGMIILNSVSVSMSNLSTAASNASIVAGSNALSLGNILPLVLIAGAIITFLIGSFAARAMG
jgi:riboflavin transporter FmnP